MNRIAFALMSAALLTPALAHADCDVRLTNLAATQPSYDPFAPVPALARVTANVSNSESSTCPVEIALSPATPSFSLSLGADALQARLAGAGSVGAYGAERAFYAPPGASSVDFDILVEAGQVVSPGAYSVVLTATIVNESGAAALTFDQRSALFETEVLARAEASVATNGGGWGGASGGVIDFGELTPGETGQATVQVRANTYVQINVSSASASELVRAGAGAGEPAVPFTVTLDAVPLSIAAGADQISRQPAATLAGSIYVLQVEIGQVTNLFAGAYSGTVEIDVLPQ